MNIRIANEEIAKTTAEYLLHAGAVKLSPSAPFTWASGQKSPIYCDNRMTLSVPAVRTFMKEQLVALVRREYPEAEGIAGVATAGIPQGALIADQLGLPLCYVRPKPKEHGMGNLIEGRIAAGLKVVVVEDLVSTGGSSLKAAEALKNADAQLLGMVAIFTYGLPQSEVNFANAGVKLACLCNYEMLIKVAAESGVIRPADMATLEAWKKSPSNWSAAQ